MIISCELDVFMGLLLLQPYNLQQVLLQAVHGKGAAHTHTHNLWLTHWTL